MKKLIAVLAFLLALPLYAGPPKPLPNAFSHVHLTDDQGFSGITLQIQNGGSLIGTFGGGVVTLNCSTNTACSISGSTVTLTSTNTASTAFSALTTSDNTVCAPCRIGTGGTLSTTGTGIINATQLLGSTWAIPAAIGSTTPNTGAFSTVSLTGQLTSTLATGTAPFSVTSTTPVANLSIGGNAATATDALGLTFGSTIIPLSSTAPTANQCLAADGSAANIIGVTCGGGGVTLQTNGVANGSNSTLNFVTSATNSTGLSATPSNLNTNQEKFEVGGTLNLASLTAPSTAGDVACANSTPLWADCVPGVVPRTVSSGPDTIVAGDRLNLIVSTSSTAVAASIVSAASLGNNFPTKVCVQGAGTYTITPTTSTINGGSSYAVTQGHCATIISDNTNYTAYATSGLLTTDSTLTQTASAFGAQLALTSTSLPFGGGVGASFQDVTEIAAPANPAAGNDRLYADSTSHTIKCLTSSGGSCLAAGGGGSTWDAIGNPLGSLSLTMGADTSTFTYNATTGAGVNLFTLTDTTNNTGTGNLFRVGTASGSAASPMQLFATGSASGTFTNAVAEDITNLTAATSSQEQPSPVFQLSGNIWNGTATTKDTVTSQITYSGATNPAVIWQLGHSGSTSTSFNLYGPTGMTFNISPNAGTGPNIGLGSGTNGILTITNSGTGNTIVKGSATISDVVGIFRSGNASPTGDVAQFQSSGSVVEASVGPSGIVQSAGTQIISAADYTNSTTTPSTVFSWTLPPTVAAKTYRYSCTITWESTNTTLVGPVFGLNISAAPTQLTGTGYVKSVLNSITSAEAEGYISNTTTGSQTLVTGNAAGVTNTNYFAKIWGTIEGAPTAGSTFIINAASTSATTATLNIRRGSSCSLQ